MAEILIQPAIEANDIACVRSLMEAYGAYLASRPHGAANICLEGYGQELERLPHPYEILLLARVDGSPAGCAALKEIHSPAIPEAKACELKRLWVSGEFRGYGLGRRLMEEALSWAEEQGLEAMYLDTVPAAMPEANRMYETMGFHQVERYNRNPIANVVFFRRSIESSGQT